MHRRTIEYGSALLLKRQQREREDRELAEQWALGLEAEDVMHLEVTETPKVTIKPAGTCTHEIGPIYERPHINIEPETYKHTPT